MSNIDFLTLKINTNCIEMPAIIMSSYLSAATVTANILLLYYPYKCMTISCIPYFKNKNVTTCT